MKRLWIIPVLVLLIATPVFAASPIESLISSLREAGFALILLWLLTLAIVYGILSHVEIPKSISARGVISIVASFMVLLAASVGSAATFVTNLVMASILVAFGLIIVMIFLEITGTKAEGEHIFAKHPRFFGAALIILMILIFIGAGGLGLLNIPAIRISEPIIAMIFFLAVMAVAIWVLMKETGEK
ncbi:MAG: hypothetical protein ACE5J4_03470 [Candidatus Aenigmatarchaeota archaeon]